MAARWRGVWPSCGRGGAGDVQGRRSDEGDGGAGKAIVVSVVSVVHGAWWSAPSPERRRGLRRGAAPGGQRDGSRCRLLSGAPWSRSGARGATGRGCFLGRGEMRVASQQVLCSNSAALLLPRAPALEQRRRLHRTGAWLLRCRPETRLAAVHSPHSAHASGNSPRRAWLWRRAQGPAVAASRRPRRRRPLRPGGTPPRGHWPGGKRNKPLYM